MENFTDFGLLVLLVVFFSLPFLHHLAVSLFKGERHEEETENGPGKLADRPERAAEVQQ